LLHALTHTLGLRGSFFSSVSRLEFDSLGYIVVGVFLLAWVAAAVIWRVSRRATRGSQRELYATGESR
jgi:nickel/cobalt transporter (NiCoT) family protein